MTARIACALFMDGVDRVVTVRRAVGLVFDVAVSPEQVVVGGRGGRRLLSVHSPAEFGAVNVLAVGAAHRLTGFLYGVSHVRDGDAGDQPDDGHHHHDFDEGESGASVCFHSAVLVCIVIG